MEGKVCEPGLEDGQDVRGDWNRAWTRCGQVVASSQVCWGSLEAEPWGWVLAAGSCSRASGESVAGWGTSGRGTQAGMEDRACGWDSQGLLERRKQSSSFPGHPLRPCLIIMPGNFIN